MEKLSIRIPNSVCLLLDIYVNDTVNDYPFFRGPPFVLDA